MKKKQTRWIVLMCCLVIIMFAAAAQAGYEDDGTYETEAPYPVDADGNGIDDYYIFRPIFGTGEESHPIIVFCVGTNSHPFDEERYRTLLNDFASHGIVVIAGTSGNQVLNDADQALDALDWLTAQNQISGEFYHKLNTSKIVSMGHSQGGAACIHVALRAPQEIGVAITAIASLMPGTGEVNGGSPITYSDINVPIFYVGAEQDWVIWPYLTVLPQYRETINAPAWFGVHLDSGHFEVPDTMLTTIKAWLYAHLYDDDPTVYSDDAENVFYGEISNWGFIQDSNWEGQRRKNL